MQAVLTIDDLPATALDAAAEFHARWVPEVRTVLEDEETSSLAIVLDPAPYDHTDWRRSAARDLARALAPKRVNIVAGRKPEAIAATLDYLRDAPGVTGQYHPLHGD